MMLFLCFLSIILPAVSPYICNHAPLPAEELQTGFTGGSQDAPSPMEVMWYSTCTSSNSSCDSVAGAVLEEMLSNTSDYIRNNFFVKKSSSSLHLARNCPPSQTDAQYCTEQCSEETYCGPARVPLEHLGRCYVCVSDEGGKRCGFTVGSTLGAGVAGHLVVYLTREGGGRCEQDPVQASACQVGPDDNRPIAGFINICPDHNIPEEDLTNVLLHQLFHIMGVSSNLYNLGAADIREFQTGWRTADQDNYFHTEKTFVGGKSNDFMSQYFECDKDYGVLMENQDPGFSHVEDRIFHGEGLTVNVTKNSVFSDLTFAILEDTGWYFTGQTQEPTFARSLGCDVLDRSCSLWVAERESNHDNIYPFCDVSSVSYTCTPEHSTVTECQRQVYSVGTVPAAYQYHAIAGNSYSAGPYPYSDYCMMFSSAGVSCRIPLQQPTNNPFLETHSTDSVCVLHDGEWDVNGGGQSKGAGCYSVCCRDDNFDVSDVNREVHSCYQAKQTVHVASPNNNIRGSLQCPAWDDVCGRGNNKKCTTPGKCLTPSLTNGQVYSSQGMYQITVGTTLSYLCFDGYIMRGSQSSVCLGNNIFSVDIPDCKLPCEDPTIENGIVLKSAGSSLIGDVIQIECNTDYKLTGDSTLKCISPELSYQNTGRWQPTPPTCQKEYLAWSDWAPCSVNCGLKNMGERIRTRGCSACSDFEWESQPCYPNNTCSASENAGRSAHDPDRSFILISVFGVLFVLTIVFIISILWYFNKMQNQQTPPRLFNESYYLAQQNALSHRRERSMDLSSEYSAASGSMKQLFTSPPTTPYYKEIVIPSQNSEDSLDGIGRPFYVPRVKYKTRARVFPKKPPPPYQERNEVTTVEMTEIRSTSDTGLSDVDKLRASITAARLRMKNHPAMKRLVVPNPVTGGNYNPNQIPFEIAEERDEENEIGMWDGFAGRNSVVFEGESPGYGGNIQGSSFVFVEPSGEFAADNDRERLDGIEDCGTPEMSEIIEESEKNDLSN